MKLLSWNLFHGRAVPAAGHELLAEFAAAIAAWSWDVALLQEVPPWWGPALAQAAGAQEYSALTSRNSALPLRRAIARRRPDLIKANGGGANVILSRWPISDHGAVMLRRLPERRVAQIAQVGEVCVVNLHASRAPWRAEEELAAAFALARGAAVVGGDFNLRNPQPAAGFIHLAGHEVDHFCGRDLTLVGSASMPETGLSDHRPLLCEVSEPGAAELPRGR